MTIKIISGKGIVLNGKYFAPGAVFDTDDTHGSYLTRNYPAEYQEVKDTKPEKKIGGSE
jgi:hypothetical protein